MLFDRVRIKETVLRSKQFSINSLPGSSVRLNELALVKRKYVACKFCSFKCCFGIPSIHALILIIFVLNVPQFWETPLQRVLAGISEDLSYSIPQILISKTVPPAVERTKCEVNKIAFLIYILIHDQDIEPNIHFNHY